MFQLWSDMFNRCVLGRQRATPTARRLMSRVLSPSPRLEDEERLRVLVMMAAQELANGISYSGHVYAATRAGRHLTPAGDLQEVFGGIEQVGAGFLVAGRLPEYVGVYRCSALNQVKFMKRVAEMSDLTQVIRTLPRIRRHLFNPENMRSAPSRERVCVSVACVFGSTCSLVSFRCAVNAAPEEMCDAAAQLESFMEAVSKNRKRRKTVRSNIKEVKQAASGVAPLFHRCVCLVFFKCSFLVGTTGPSK